MYYQDDYFGNGQDPFDFQDILINKRITDDFLRNQGLKKIWTTKYLWALGTGTVLSGFYVHWQVPERIISPWSFLTAYLVAGLVYLVYFSLGVGLIRHFPYTGGLYAFARRGWGTWGGFMAGMTVVYQFMFGFAAVASLAKNYLHGLWPGYAGSLIIVITMILTICYMMETALAARIQFMLVGCGLSGLILFFIGSADYFGTTPGFSFDQFPLGTGIVHAFPFVLWCLFGLEGFSLVAEETKNLGRTMSQTLGAVGGTVFFAFLGLWLFAVRPMPEFFFNSQGHPTWYILQKIQSQDQVLLRTFSALILCAYVSGLNGLIHGFSRQVYALARAGYLPLFLSNLHTTYRTPYLAVLIPVTVSLSGAFLLPLDFLIYFSLISALLGHLFMIASYYRINKYEPDLFSRRGFRQNPLVLAVVFSLVLVVFGLLVYLSGMLVLGMIGIWALTGSSYFLWSKSHIRDEAPEESSAVSQEKKRKIHLK